MAKYDLKTLAVSANHIWLEEDNPYRDKVCAFVATLLAANHQYAEIVTPEYIHRVSVRECNDIRPLLHAIMVHLYLDDDTVGLTAYRMVTEALLRDVLMWCTIDADGM